MAQQWYFSRTGQQEGPVTKEALAAMARAGQLQPMHLVWSPGMANWQAAGDVEGIFNGTSATAASGVKESAVAGASGSGAWQRGAIPADGYAAGGYQAGGNPNATLNYSSPHGYPPAYPAAIALGYASGLTVVFAGFWNRFLARLVDGAILFVPNVVIYGAFGTPYFHGVGRAPAAVLFHGPGMVVQIAQLVMNWLYFALQESSAAQATFGKRAIGMRVTDLAGQRISFARATGRFFGKYISALILCIGFLMIAFTEKKQGLHDILAGTLVVKDQV
jgi:uncharacterized RDD family membrane protein YckC